MEDNTFSLNIFNKFEAEIKTAIEENFRRMFIFPNEINYEILLSLFKIYLKICPRRPIKVLFASHQTNIIFQNILSNLGSKEFNIFEIKFFKINKILGQTYDILALDLTEQLKPNDLGILIEVLRGGGFILVLTPNFEGWKNTITPFQQKLISPPFTAEDLNFRFTPYFVNKLCKYKGIIIFDLKNNEIREGSIAKYETTPPKLEIQQTAPFKSIFYKMATTGDQKVFLNSLDFILEKGEKKRVLILTADRGRGKSAALGIGAVAYSHFLIEKFKYPKVKIIITAPSIENLEVLMNHAQETLNALNYKVKKKKKSLITNRITIQYKNLVESFAEKANLTIIDECAGIALPVLFNILENSHKIIFSSTLHGYEGAGRGFSILFRKELSKKKNIKVSEIVMNQPIRYSFNDPIEYWLFDTLFLNAKPVRLSNNDVTDVINSNLEVKRIDLDQCFLGKEQELFIQFAGIFVFAHYRNQPDDIAVLSDSPHHEAWAIFTKIQKNIVNVVQIAKEGNLSEQTIQKMLSGEQTPGNLIPWISITHFRNSNIAKLKGVRIVRIATHPDLFQKGLGSEMLRQIEENYKNLNFDWIGTSFGLSHELLNFWVKNGYGPIHLSSRITPSTGEYSIIMIKPLSIQSENIVKLLQQEFRFKIFEWLRSIFYDLSPTLDLNLLESTQRLEEPVIFKINLTENQQERLIAYFNGNLDYSNTSDVINQLLKYYFLNFKKDTIKLSQKQKELTIMRCLQARTWQQTLNSLNLKYPVANGLLRKAIKKISRVL